MDSIDPWKLDKIDTMQVGASLWFDERSLTVHRYKDCYIVLPDNPRKAGCIGRTVKLPSDTRSLVFSLNWARWGEPLENLLT
jgi:hypothetical protein